MRSICDESTMSPSGSISVDNVENMRNIIKKRCNGVLPGVTRSATLALPALLLELLVVSGRLVLLNSRQCPLNTQPHQKRNTRPHQKRSIIHLPIREGDVVLPAGLVLQVVV